MNTASFSISLLQLRLVMKTYSFIRENVVKVIYPWNKDDEQGPPLWYKGQMESSVGSFRKYLYFLFAPTFLYRDRYPRSVTTFFPHIHIVTVLLRKDKFISFSRSEYLNEAFNECSSSVNEFSNGSQVVRIQSKLDKFMMVYCNIVTFF